MSEVAAIEQLKGLIAADPAALDGAAAAGDIKTASVALAQFAASKGLNVSAETVEKAFTDRGAGSGQIQALDDAALDQVAGGGSPYCIMTKGCYCILTKLT